VERRDAKGEKTDRSSGKGEEGGEGGGEKGGGTEERSSRSL